MTGFKPTFDFLPMEGVLPLSKSLDTLGFFTHTPTDMIALWESLGNPVAGPEDFALGTPEPMPKVDPVMVTAFQNALSRLRSSGASLRSVDISGMLAKLSEASITVMFYEGARFHQQRYNVPLHRNLKSLANQFRKLREPVTVLVFCGRHATIE